MRTVPVNIVQKISWYEEHAALWVTNQAQLNLTAAQTTEMTGKVTAAKNALSEQQAAQTAAKGKTLALRQAVDELSAFGSDLLKDIRATAAAAPSGGVEIYELAGIPAPALPSPVPPPGTASDFSVTLVPADGSLRLAWKCVNPANASGVLYEVERKLGAGGAFVMVGTTGSRKLVDATVPAGTSEVWYRITAARTTGKGIPAAFSVMFGVGGAGAGQMTASVVTAGARMAA